MFDLGGRIFNIQFFTSSGTYTPTKGAKSALVICVGGGGGASAYVVDAVAGSNGGASSFGSIISCTGGGGAPNGANPGTQGTSTGATVPGLTAGETGGWAIHFLGYGRGGRARSSVSVSGDFGNLVAFDRCAGGSGGLGVALAKQLATTSVTVGGGGTSRGASGTVVTNGSSGCVIVIEMK